MSTPASLRRRLLLAGAGGIVLAALSAAWLLGAAFERAAQRALDRRLDDDLDKLVALAEVSSEGSVRLSREPVDERYDRIFSGWYWAVEQGGQMRASRSAWDESALESTLRDAGTQRTFGEIAGPRGQRLRTASQRVRFARSGETLGFAVAGDLAEVRAEARDFRLFAGVAVALIAAALLGAMTLQIGFGLRPLRRVGDTVQRLRRGEDARFDSAALPAEVAPLAAQVNDLLDEHARRVERARNAAQDLAHALKTPLAALALEAQRPGPELAMRVQEQVQRMRADIERRLSGSFAADTRQRTPIAAVAIALRALMLRAHAARELTIDVAVPADLLFAGSREDLEEMLGNLLDNACKWARARVRVQAMVDGARLRIRVDDDGPGLPASDAERAVTRGVRLDERTPGSGLGLAIAQEIAVSHGGDLRLSQAEWGGVRAELEFPAAA